MSRKAVIAGCARNCAAPLPAALANMERLSSVFDDSAFVIVENDSTDGTKSVLEDWARQHAGARLVCMDGLARCPYRTVRLAIARNTILDVIRNSALAGFDYLVVMDMDNVNEAPIAPEAARRCLQFLESAPEHAAMFANQSGVYFDMWALREARRCATDIWEDVFRYAMQHSCSDEEAFRKTYVPRHFSLPQDAAPLEVDSAFGGLGLYKLGYALKARYVGEEIKLVSSPPDEFRIAMQVCEHVAFNGAIRAAGGRLFVAPWLINWDTKNDVQYLVPSFFRGLLIEDEA